MHFLLYLLQAVLRIGSVEVIDHGGECISTP
jgi:hypothetical protein